MGPVIFITGNVRAEPRFALAQRASMGPVIFITGNDHAEARLAVPAFAASMGPVIFITGNVSSDPGSPAWPCGFNGAGDLHHRKPPIALTPLPVAVTASMGPVIFITGNGPRLDRGTVHAPASMGPVIFITGNLRVRCLRMGRYRDCFNGAGDLHHRKRPRRETDRSSGYGGFNGAGDLHHRKHRRMHWRRRRA